MECGIEIISIVGGPKNMPSTAIREVMGDELWSYWLNEVISGLASPTKVVQARTLGS